MEEKSNAVELAVEITTAWLSNPNTRVAPEDVHTFLKNSHSALVGMIDPPVEAAPAAEEAPAEYQGAVSARKSLADPDIIISMIDGKPYKALRRHLATHGLTPDTYRERYGLKADYPMVAPNYSKRRAEVAKALGLGRKRVAPTEVAADEATASEAAAAPVSASAGKPKAKRSAKAAAKADA
ncbi:MucR family transcriptional regulator [Aureimonas phyllosphaerae]|uniref:Putative transcriptional regulator n=1 Tax=Aureimonas phyllosphaerae TaxID=1166078 RepID=A0A7W6BN95_9HYPH|nr:MucR family transcriptional regulator [Aureimonas phyllosphaerae]MBB3933892.1 putative transcriptional regulator [Aureimonas phyllosphaerae]MBB3958892.1 putative transcriptional regulator [Aureimonas phyllosphaerae]SFF20733.1 transcriptional regulator, MucR family [Aureimonas phyllosphaerae]